MNYCSHLLLILDSTQIVKKCIDDFNNSLHLSMKASKKVVEILIDYTEKISSEFHTNLNLQK